MNLASLLVNQARLHPERPALVDRHHGVDRVVTYGELLRRVAAGARELQEFGLKRGQVVLVFQPVSIELYEFLLAAFYSGLQVMLADPYAGRKFLSLCCKRLEPDAFFGSWKAHCLRLIVPEMRGIPISICCGWFPAAEAWKTDGEGVSLVDVADEDAALVTFTSGSTGVPKAAVRSHGFLLAQHRVLSKSLEYKDGEVDLITLPVFVLANLASGLTSVLAATDLANPSVPDATAVSRQCRKFQVTRCAASPAFFEGLLADELPFFEKLYTGGAPVFPDLLRRLRRVLPDSHIHAVYGSTEAEPIAHFSADQASDETDLLTRRGAGLCSGVPVHEIRLQIIADRWGTPLVAEDLEFLSVGYAGEIIVSGDHVLRGYLDALGDRETKIHDGGKVWHRTGDAGWMDVQGRVWLLGRCAEKLMPFPAGDGLPSNALCYPFAIECALREIFPEIRMAAITWKNQRTLIVGKICDSVESTAIEKRAEDFGIMHVIYLKSIPLDQRHHAKIDYPTLKEILKT